jgi:hypothetical protein
LVPEDICQVRSRLVTTFIGKLIMHRLIREHADIRFAGSLMATAEKM